MDVGDWLRSLGLGQHEALFRENEIDAEVLPELTEADLEKLGVPMGHRKWLLKAIADEPRARADIDRRRRASPAHSDVLRSRRTDGARVS